MKVDAEVRNFGLDVMRCIAISLVFFVHLFLAFVTANFSAVWYFSYLGVDVFFVLSGYLIGTLLIQSRDDAGRFSFDALQRFLIRRWMRTVPLYYFVFLIGSLIGIFILKSINHLDFRYFFWVQNLIHSPRRFFLESWSLSVEEWFYILFPLGMFFFLKIYPKKNATALLAYLLGFILLGIAIRSSYSLVRFSEFRIVLTRLDAIGYGVLFAVLDLFYWGDIFKKFRRCLLIGGVVFVSIGSYLFLKSSLPVYLHLFYYPLSGLGLSFIMIFLKGLTIRNLPLFIIKLVRLYSKMSYSIYLNNVFIILLVGTYIPGPAFYKFFIAMLLTLLVSFFTYTLIERTFIRLRESWSLTKKQILNK